MSEALKPCPFCGGAAKVKREDGNGRMSQDWFAAGCFHYDGDEDCPGFASWHETEAAAVAFWNRRADATDMAALVAVRDDMAAQEARIAKHDGWWPIPQQVDADDLRAWLAAIDAILGGGDRPAT